MVKQYWVVGGKYESTEFLAFAPGSQEERYGPFAALDDAQREWQRHAWRTVDNCLYRYRIVEENGTDRRDAA
ncbi:MAG: DUF4170 domain-containing protein [Rhodospirillales bacterium]